MTAEEWEVCQAPDRMFGFVGGRLSARSLRLFACACCRLHWNRYDAAHQRAIEVAERLAEGQANEWEVLMAEDALPIGVSPTGERVRRSAPALALARDLCAPLIALETLRRAISEADRSGGPRLEGIVADYWRDVAGNPWRQGRQIARSNPPNDRTVLTMARVIYDEWRFEDLPILADALEDAGCEDANVLRHCRQDRPHVRGCWVLDWILGRN